MSPNSKVGGSQSRDFALQLLDAENESRVTEIIHVIEDSWNVDWEPHGPQQNYVVAHSNAPDPVASFAEPVVNSIDAILTKRYRQLHGDHYNDSHGLKTAEQAVDTLFDGPVDEDIEIIADGDPSGHPNLTVRDTGEGQPPEEFEERFMQLVSGGQIKYDWPFTQGRFKMGGSAVLPWAGDRGYKFILSAGFEQPGEWSWSIIRDNREDGLYEYLRINGSIPNFSGDVRGQNHGTFIKVYEYELKRASTIAGGFRELFDRVLVDPAIPITINETRDISAVAELKTRGLYGRLGQTRVQNHVKIDRTFQYDFGEPFGLRDIRVVIFKDTKTVKEDDRLSKRSKDVFVGGSKHINQAVFFLVNGQTHAHERASFLTGRSRCSFPHTGKDTLVFMDLSDFADKQKHDRGDFFQLFKPSRDRMGGTEIADQLVDGLESALKEYKPLKDEEDWRRRRVTTSKRDERMENILQSVLERNPSIKRYLMSGDKPKVPGLDKPNPQSYSAPFYPSHINIVKKFEEDGLTLWDESGGTFTKREAENRNAWMWFDIDAPNDYFNRDKQPGELSIEPREIVKQRSLNDGILSLQLQPHPTEAKSGTTLPVKVSVSRGSSPPLNVSFEVEYVDPAKQGKRRRRKTKKRESQTQQLDLPNPVEVFEQEGEITWEDMEPEWTEDDIVSIFDSESQMDIFINMDASPFHYFITRNNLTDSGKEFVTDVWKAGVTLYTLSQYIELRDVVDNGQFNGKQTDIQSTNVVSITMKGVAQTMLDQHISEEELKPYLA